MSLGLQPLVARVQRSFSYNVYHGLQARLCLMPGPALTCNRIPHNCRGPVPAAMLPQTLTVPHQEPRGWLLHRELETVFSDMLTFMETLKVTPKRLSFVFALSSQCGCSFLRSLITFLYRQSIEQWESQSYTFILLEGEYSVLEI